MPTSTELEKRCAFLERELSEVGIQLDAAQKRLRIADTVIEGARAIIAANRSRAMAEHRAWKARIETEAAIAAWDMVPGDEGHRAPPHDTEGR